MAKHTWKKMIVNGTVCLVPDCTDAAEWLKKTKLGQGVLIDPRRPRNIQHHKKLMAILTLGADNWEDDGESTPMTKERLLMLLKLLVGHSDPSTVKKSFVVSLFADVFKELPPQVIDAIPENVTIYTPRSINFESLPQDDFDPIYKSMVDAISRKLGVSVEDLYQQASEI